MFTHFSLCLFSSLLPYEGSRFSSTLPRITDKWSYEAIPVMPDALKQWNRPPRFDLPWHTWATLNRICTSVHGRCKAFLFNWGFTESPECDWGASLQKMKHIVYEYDRRVYLGYINDFTVASSQAIQYILNLGVNTAKLQGLDLKKWKYHTLYICILSHPIRIPQLSNSTGFQIYCVLI